MNEEKSQLINLTTRTRLSISLKIGGSMVLLLSIMMAVIFFSYELTKRADERLVMLADHVIPITNSLAEIEVHALDQELVFALLLQERLLSDASPLELPAMQVFEDLGIKVDEEIEVAEARVALALEGDGVSTSKIQLAKIAPLLQIIEREHQSLHDHIVEYLSIPKEGNEEILALYERQLEVEKVELNHVMAQAYETLEHFTSTEATSVTGQELQAHQISLFIAIGTFLTGLLLSPFFTRQIVKPLKQLTNGVKTVAEGDLEVNIPVHSTDEIGQLSHSFNYMVEELKMKQAIKQMFGKYVHPRIVDKLITSNGELEQLASEKQIMTVFFSDIVNFSPMAEALTPNALVNLINHYFTTVSKPIVDSNGVVDKFIGDAVMAFWGPPFISHQSFAENACLAALEQIEALKGLNESIPDLLEMRHNYPQIEIRIGLCTGPVVAGNIGSKDIMSYTLMGETVNIAARIETVNKAYNTSILLEQTTLDRIGNKFTTRRVDKIQVVGIKEPVTIYELLATAAKTDKMHLDLKSQYESALESYFKQDWPTAIHIFEDILERHDDGPSRTLLQRMIDIENQDLDENWDGVWRMSHK